METKVSHSARNAILSRVRQALRTPSPEPHWAHEPVKSGAVFPLPEENERARRARFRDEFAAIQGEWLEADSVEAGQQLFADWWNRQEWTSALVMESPGFRRFFEGRGGITWVSEDSAFEESWASLDVGVTAAESLVCESGSIIVSSMLCGRATSVLPPVHVVLATADQLVPDLETALVRLGSRYPERFPSSVSCISGPSRTADIEKILVLGAHGPKRLIVLLLPAGALAA